MVTQKKRRTLARARRPFTFLLGHSMRMVPNKARLQVPFPHPHAHAMRIRNPLVLAIVLCIGTVCYRYPQGAIWK